MDPAGIFLVSMGSMIFVGIFIRCTCKNEGQDQRDSRRRRGGGRTVSELPRDIRSTTASSSTGLSPSAIAALPSFAYRERPTAQEEAAQTACTVCQGVVEEGQMVRLLPVCMHMWHVECIDKWLSSHSTCPVCRADAEPAKVAQMVMELREGSAPPTAPWSFGC